MWALRHSTIHDVDTVIIDGIVRKRGGKLSGIDVKIEAGEGAEFQAPQQTLSSAKLEWSEVATALVKSREKVAARIDALDMEAGARGVIKAFGIDEDKLIRS